MPKVTGGGTRPKTARKRAPKAAPKHAPARQRRLTALMERIEAPPRLVRSEAMQLAAEVARLEFELAVARAQMVNLEARTETDPLTEILNRRGFERELRRSLAYVKRHGTGVALLYVDLDDFKRINDRHGHAAGDAMLKAIAMLLGRHVRAADLAARIGGDEFAVLLWNCNEADAQAKALALEAAIGGTTATFAGEALAVGASCGVVSLLPLDRPADVLDRADRAMYARKAARGGLRRAAGA